MNQTESAQLPQQRLQSDRARTATNAPPRGERTANRARSRLFGTDMLDLLVLVVDDDPTVRRTAKSVFEHFGARVLTGGDGQEAIDLFAVQGDEIALVFLDMQMPIKGGAEALEGIRRLRPDVPAILSSGCGRAAAAGLTEQPLTTFLPKPWNFEQLIASARLVLKPVT